MINKIKSLMFALSAMLIIAAPALVPASVVAKGHDVRGNLCSGANLDITGKTTTCDDTTKGNTLNEKIAKFINIISAIIGVVAVFMIIYAGFRYVTSGGNDAGIATAKKTILYALVGLVIVALAQLIVRFVINTTNV